MCRRGCSGICWVPWSSTTWLRSIDGLLGGMSVKKHFMHDERRFH
jgi:hypothetical protein